MSFDNATPHHGSNNTTKTPDTSTMTTWERTVAVAAESLKVSLTLLFLLAVTNIVATAMPSAVALGIALFAVSLFKVGRGLIINAVLMFVSWGEKASRFGRSRKFF